MRLWRSLASTERLITTAREELHRRGIALSEANIRNDLERVDKKLAHSRGTLARLVRYHAEGGTLDEATFESAAQPLQQEVHALEAERESLLDTLPGARWEADQQAIRQIASDVLQRLDSLGFDEKQRLIALLDVQVDLEPNGAFTASMIAPRPTDSDQHKVLMRTSSRSDLHISLG